ncbi:GTP cyclohydrolase 1 feedback regulatory protein-like [Saccostrea echinata]|uniref:GTP cyclohydrolase 1 feedback regulatory protein-like n=1 Tax=Saccostrea echinata TaxID=191078 RepID=UPI002A8350F6|nr:GTP cyclohydrolase 1 feedback regulatory protein-like [Saccostrea echinata]
MPFVLISTQIRLETGPTVCGDEWSDPDLMEYLGARLTKALGNNFKEYISVDPVRIILDKLEKRGYKVIAMTGLGQTCIWTLQKDSQDS